MKTYLLFSIEGELTEYKTKDKSFDSTNYTTFSYIYYINYNKNNFIILYNKNVSDKKNITVLPFYNKEIYGAFIVFLTDSENNLKSFTEVKFLKLLNISQKNIDQEYSSDDFNLSDE